MLSILSTTGLKIELFFEGLGGERTKLGGTPSELLHWLSLDLGLRDNFKFLLFISIVSTSYLYSKQTNLSLKGSRRLLEPPFKGENTIFKVTVKILSPLFKQSL